MAEQAVVGLSAEQLSDIIPLIRESDSVELKVSVPDAARRSAVAALGMDPLDAQIRQVVFFDTPDLTLNQCGVVLRLRRVQGKPADAIVKLRPVVPGNIAPSIRRSPKFSVEVDAMPGGFMCSAAMKIQVDPEKAKRAIAGQQPLRKLFDGDQRDLYTAHAPPGLGMDQLEMLGPINVLKLKFTPGDFGRRLVAELWWYPDGSRVLELSTKCTPEQAFEVAAETKAFLAGRGLDLGAEQQTKTKRALEFFANELRLAGTDR